MQSKTYTDLLTLVQGLAGVDAFTTQEQIYVLGFVNRRLYQAYNSCQTWPRYLVAAEARPATSDVIAYTYDTAAGTETSTAATRSTTTVTVVCSTGVSFVTGMWVTVANLGYGTTNPNGTYQVTGVSTTTLTSDTFTYELTSGTSTETYTGAGTITPSAVSSIEQVFHIWDANPFAIYSTPEYDYFTGSDGIHVVNNAAAFSGFWVSYRAAWPGPYTTVSTDIPLEFFYYAAHATYADFLRMDGQVDKAMAEEQMANDLLLTEMSKADNQRNTTIVFRRLQTHASRQAR